MAETMALRMKSRLVRMVANGAPTTGAASRAQSGSPVPTTEPADMGPPHGLPSGHPTTQQWANMQVANVQENMHGNMHGNMQQYPPDSPFHQSMNGRMTPNGYGPISEAQIYNPDTNEHIIMPPPNFYPGQFGNQYADGAPGPSDYQDNGVNMDQNQYNQMVGDWYAVPLDPVINSYGADVNSTMFGPNIGNFDLLDIYRNDVG
jgi:hypothetical protein